MSWKKFDSKVYMGTNHGFAVRGDEHNDHVRVQRGQEFKDTVDFFKSMV
jgi:dienelactone hydrolase